MKTTMQVMWLLMVLSASAAPAQPRNREAAGAEVTVRTQAQEDAMRVEGEKRFHANCGRCHQAPQKFPPRMMLTITRHMRVRALVTDEDVRLILHYLTQ